MRQRTSLKSFTMGASLAGHGPYGGQVKLTVPKPGFLDTAIAFGDAKAIDNNGTGILTWAPGSYTFNVSDDGKVARLTGFVAHEDKGESEP